MGVCADASLSSSHSFQVIACHKNLMNLIHIGTQEQNSTKHHPTRDVWPKGAAAFGLPLPPPHLVLPHSLCPLKPSTDASNHNNDCVHPSARNIYCPKAVCSDTCSRKPQPGQHS
jgi:hypothetical protein